MFFARIGEVIADIESLYDVVVIDCPPQLGFLTMSALCAATGVLITVHPQMLDVMSMSQFLAMTSELMAVVERAGGRTSYDWMRYLVTRYEPNDGPQSQMTGFMRAIFGNRMLQNAMLKSTAISDAGVTKQTLYEVERSQFIRGTYDRAMDSLNAVNGEIELLLRATWGGSDQWRVRILSAYHWILLQCPRRHLIPISRSPGRWRVSYHLHGVPRWVELQNL